MPREFEEWCDWCDENQPAGHGYISSAYYSEAMTQVKESVLIERMNELMSPLTPPFDPVGNLGLYYLIYENPELDRDLDYGLSSIRAAIESRESQNNNVNNWEQEMVTSDLIRTEENLVYWKRVRESVIEGNQQDLTTSFEEWTIWLEQNQESGPARRLPSPDEVAIALLSIHESDLTIPDLEVVEDTG